jgi:hypothetical protein
MASINVAYEAVAGARPEQRFGCRQDSQVPKEDGRRRTEDSASGTARSNPTVPDATAAVNRCGPKWRHGLFAGWIVLKAITIISALS